MNVTIPQMVAVGKFTSVVMWDPRALSDALVVLTYSTFIHF